MFGIDFGRKKREAERRAFAQKLDGRHLRCVSERINGMDEVIGREGALILRDGELLVFASSDILFRCDTARLDAAELLSLDGVVLEGPDAAHGDTPRKLIAYYTYYR